MFFKKKNSALNKALNLYQDLFINWDRDTFNDGSIDEVSFKNENIKIVFQEDLREHIVNIFILNSQNRIAKIYYREVFSGDNLIGIEKLKKSISMLENKNNVEAKEIEIYVEFLKSNKIIK